MTSHIAKALHDLKTRSPNLARAVRSYDREARERRKASKSRG